MLQPTDYIGARSFAHAAALRRRIFRTLENVAWKGQGANSNPCEPNVRFGSEAKMPTSPAPRPL